MKLAEYQRPPIRVALMGLGRVVFEEHYSVFTQHPDLFKVVAACDTSKERRDIVAKDYPECRMFRQYEDMLDEHDIDVVLIATPSVSHVKHAMASLQRGYWTLVESPLALTQDEVQMLRGQAMKAKNRLLVVNRSLFSAEYLLAKQAMEDKRLGTIYDIIIRAEDYVRRDDWQSVKRMGGGAAFYQMPDLILATLRLLPLQPVQMWSILKRIASVGDSEDFAHVNLKTRGLISADIEYNGGLLAPSRSPAYTIRGDRGVFTVMPGATEGTLKIIDPNHKFSRRRSSVRQPPLDNLHEDIPQLEIKTTLPPGTDYGQSAFWKCVYNTVRIASPFPIALDEIGESLKFASLMKKTSPFGP